MCQKFNKTGLQNEKKRCQNTKYYKAHLSKTVIPYKSQNIWLQIGQNDFSQIIKNNIMT